MSFRKKLLILYIISIIAFSIPTTITKAGSLAIGPTQIYIPETLRKAEYDTTLFLTNTHNQEINISLTTSDEINNMTSFYIRNESQNPIEYIPITYIKIPPNSREKITARIKIPEDLPNGNYSGQIYPKQQSEEEEKEGHVKVDVVFPIKVDFTVIGDERLELSVNRTNVIETEIGYPFYIDITFDNTGNVVATPNIYVTFTKDGFYQDKIQDTDRIQPGKISKKTVEWNTTGKISGRYMAHINITLRDENIHQENISFELLPPGTLNRMGTLEKLEYSGKLEKNSTITITARFRNMGKLETKARFIGEVYLDESLIDTIQSEELRVLPYRSVNLRSYFKITEAGHYKIDGYVVYEGDQTNISTIEFTVSEDAYLGPILFPLILISTIGFVIFSISYISYKKAWNKIRKKMTRFLSNKIYKKIKTKFQKKESGLIKKIKIRFCK